MCIRDSSLSLSLSLSCHFFLFSKHIIRKVTLLVCILYDKSGSHFLLKAASAKTSLTPTHYLYSSKTSIDFFNLTPSYLVKDTDRKRNPGWLRRGGGVTGSSACSRSRSDTSRMSLRYMMGGHVTAFSSFVTDNVDIDGSQKPQVLSHCSNTEVSK